MFRCDPQLVSKKGGAQNRQELELHSVCFFREKIFSSLGPQRLPNLLVSGWFNREPPGKRKDHWKWKSDIFEFRVVFYGSYLASKKSLGNGRNSLLGGTRFLASLSSTISVVWNRIPQEEMCSVAQLLKQLMLVDDVHLIKMKKEIHRDTPARCGKTVKIYCESWVYGYIDYIYIE